jgi:KipI family sensor histidine kinase inhibitor|tara:strand:- start:25197 stop:25970 length:774 start_codon:yes stop_codon:yes gene_type:complete
MKNLSMTEFTDSSIIWPQIKTVGLAGIIVTFAGVLSEPANRAAIAFRAAVAALEWAEVEESNSTLVSTFIRIDLSKYRPEPIVERLQELLATQDWLSAPLPTGRTLWRVPTLFGTDRAPQLAEAAELAGRSIAQAITDLSTTTMRVLTIGFAPGQPYLGTLPDHWNIPRQTSITPKVPAGSLVTAVSQFCLFPYDTPTGWRHVGATGFLSFRPNSEHPFPLSPGDEMIFDPVSEVEFQRIEATDQTGNGGAQTGVLA